MSDRDFTHTHAERTATAMERISGDETGRRGRVGHWLVGILSMVLVVVVLLTSLPGALARLWPDAALLFDSTQPQALMAKAEVMRRSYYDLVRTIQSNMEGATTNGEAPVSTRAPLAAMGDQDPGPAGRTEEESSETAGPPSEAEPSVPAGMDGEPVETAARPIVQQGAPAPVAQTAVLSVDEVRRIEQQIVTVRTEMQAVLRQIVARDPLNARAFRMLGEVERDTDRARAFMDAAVQRSRRESIAVFWLLNDTFSREQYAAAVEHADALMRTSSELRPYVMAYLARMTALPEAAEVLQKRLREHPRWRQHFFGVLPQMMQETRGLFNIMTGLKQAGDEVSAREIAPYIWALMKAKDYGFAYYAWLNLLPAEQIKAAGLLNNPGFEMDADGSPFNWHFSTFQNATGEFLSLPEEAPEGQRVLSLRLGPGQVRFPEIRQYLKLPPGRYVLSGRYRGFVRAKRGITWIAYCVDGEGRFVPAAESRELNSIAQKWTEFRFEFPVAEPDACRLVWLRLRHGARSSSEKLISGELMMDGLSLMATPN
jgi:hypothetical protein